VTSTRLNSAQRLRRMHDQLSAAYGPQHWWPAETSFEMILGAYLTQNTAGKAVERSLANLRAAGALTLDGLRSLTLEELQRLIQPSGFPTRKAPALKAFIHGFFLFGYVLMPEHMHLLLGEPKLHSHAITISVLKGETSKLLKGDRPQFWQTRYYEFNVFTQKKFAEKIDYIHSNPVTRGLVEKPEDWPWSSFRHWSTGEPGRIEIESHWTWTRRERASTTIAIKPR
jgi:hypothetical protein